MKFTIKIDFYIQTRYKMTCDTAASKRRQSISMYTLLPPFKFYVRLVA